MEQLSWKEKAQILQGKRHLTGAQGGRLFGDWIHFNDVQGQYLDLEESVVLKKDARIDRDFFAYFFAFRLSKKDHNAINNFLIVNFKEHFGEEVFAFVDFCRHEIIPNYKLLLGTKRITMMRAFMKKIQNRTPYNRIKEVKLKEKRLDEFFSEGYEGKKNAELFRVQVIHNLLEKKGKQIPGTKGKLNMVVNFLFYRKKIWRQDLELKTIADTLRKELRFKTLNPKGFQKDQIKEVDPMIEKALSGIKWIKTT